LSKSNLKNIKMRGLFITELNQKEDALELFFEAGLKKGSILIFYYKRINEDYLIERIRKNRPPAIIMDGRIDPIALSNLHEKISNIIGIYDIDTRIYAINKIVNLPGVINTDIENIVNILEQKV
jgi:hypothetical protein